MSQIKIDLDVVKELAGNLNRSMNKISSLNSSFSSLANGVNSDIAARRSIRARLNSTGQTLHDLEHRLRELMSFIQSSIESYSKTESEINKAADAIGNGKAKEEGNVLGWLSVKAAIDAFSSALDSNKLLRFGKGLAFTMYKEGGKVYIKIKGAALNGDIRRYQSLIMESLGDNARKWNYNLIRQLANGGIPLYEEGRGFFNKSSKFMSTISGDLNNYVKRLGNSWGKNMGISAWETLGEEVKFWNDFRGWKNASVLTKSGKFFGIAGTLIEIGENGLEDFKNKDTKEWEFRAENWEEFGIDTAVGIGSGAASMAAGAAYGSFFLPPAGTIVGAVAGATINLLINAEIEALGNKSIVDATKDLAKNGVDKIQEAAEAFDNLVNERMDRLAEGIEDKASQLADDIKDKASQLTDDIGAACNKLFW